MKKTGKDKKEIDKAVENYPTTEYYNASELIQNLGIGEAFVTALNEKGIPTPLVHTYLISPESRMDILTSSEIDDLTRNSNLVQKYEENIDKESAYEILNKRIEEHTQTVIPTPTRGRTAQPKEEPGMFEQVIQSRAGKTFMTTLAREGAKFILGMFSMKKRR